MNILKFETNSATHTAVSTVVDFALKGGGVAALDSVNIVLNSIKNLPEEPIVKPAVEPELIVEPQN